MAKKAIKEIHIKWTGDGSRKIVNTPIPYLSKSATAGEVICDPVGIFDPVNGKALLELSGEKGLFQLDKVIFEGGTEGTILDVEIEVKKALTVEEIDEVEGKRFKTKGSAVMAIRNGNLPAKVVDEKDEETREQFFRIEFDPEVVEKALQPST